MRRGLERGQGSWGESEGPLEGMGSSLLLLEWLPRLPQAGWSPGSVVLIFSFCWGSHELPQSGFFLQGGHMGGSSCTG